MIFSVEYDKQPQKFLEVSDAHIAKRLIEKIELLLSSDPVPHTAKRVEGEQGVFRIRVGNYRAIYRINYAAQRVVVFKLEKRSRVYS